MLTKHYSHNENETWNDFINQPIWFNSRVKYDNNFFMNIGIREI